MKCFTMEAKNFEKALNEAGITLNQFQALRKIWHELSPGGQAEVSDMLTVDEEKTGEDDTTLYFRGEEVSYGYGWSDEDTYGFDFGDGEFTDSAGNEYFIRLEYHVVSNEWVVEIWWQDDNTNIEELEESDANVYITKEEIEKVKAFAKKFMEED